MDARFLKMVVDGNFHYTVTGKRQAVKRGAMIPFFEAQKNYQIRIKLSGRKLYLIEDDLAESFFNFNGKNFNGKNWGDWNSLVFRLIPEALKNYLPESLYEDLKNHYMNLKAELIDNDDGYYLVLTVE